MSGNEIIPSPTLSPVGDFVAMVALVEETVGFKSLRMRSYRNG
jgi:hypothetical protein